MTAEAPQQKGVPLPDESKIGLSEFVARVLNQLSLSAWLPAAFFVVSLAIMLTFRHQRAIDLGVLVTTLRDSSVQWTIVLTAVPGLVIATLITQAFSFEAIRALEGYWRRGGLIAQTRTRMIKHELERKNRIAQRRTEVGHQAFLASRGRWVDLEEDPAVIDAMEAISRGKYPKKASPAVVKKAKDLNWKSLCDPWLIAEVNHLREAHREFPVDSRILPTRLGNLIRAVEDKLTHAGDDLSGLPFGGGLLPLPKFSSSMTSSVPGWTCTAPSSSVHSPSPSCHR